MSHTRGQSLPKQPAKSDFSKWTEQCAGRCGREPLPIAGIAPVQRRYSAVPASTTLAWRCTVAVSGSGHVGIPLLQCHQGNKGAASWPGGRQVISALVLRRALAARPGRGGSPFSADPCTTHPRVPPAGTENKCRKALIQKSSWQLVAERHRWAGNGRGVVVSCGGGISTRGIHVVVSE